MMIDPDLENIETTRARRMAEVWREDAPTDEEIARASRTVSRKRARPQRKAKLWVAALVQGFVLGIGTLAAASWFVAKVLLAPAVPSPVTLPVVPPTSSPRRAPLKKYTPPPVPSEEPAPEAAFDDVSPAPTKTPSTTPSSSGSSARLAAPADVEQRPLPAPGSAREAFPLVPMPELPSAQGPWERVRDALSAGDDLRADRALATLGHDPDPATRDAADLARAELWVGRGMGKGFRATVERLAATGQTPLVRRRAAALLERLQ